MVPRAAAAAPRTPADARRYLRGRGYDSDTVKQFRLGWAPGGWDALVRDAGVSADLLVGAGLAYRNQAGRLNDSFRARVLFPIFDVAGRPVGLGGRVLPGGRGPKYKNTAGDRPLRQEQGALRPQLGQRADRRAGPGRRLRGLHRRDRPAPGRGHRGRGNLRHGAGRGPRPAADRLLPPDRPRLRRRRRRPGRSRALLRLGAPLRG